MIDVRANLKTAKQRVAAVSPALKENKGKLMQLKEESKFSGGQGQAGSILVLLNLK